MSDWRRLRDDDWRRLLGGRSVAADLVPPLSTYLGLLARWAPAVDLVGRVDPESLIGEHLLPSLAGSAFLPEAGELLDVGSGNGFPAVPLLTVQRALRGVLLEPRERRWAFLREVVRELELDAEVRRERLAEHRCEGYAALTVRGVRAGAWGDDAVRVVRPGGTIMWWTTTDGVQRFKTPGVGPVITSPLPAPGRGVIAVWRRCST